jgi:hypothetical protein
MNTLQSISIANYVKTTTSLEKLILSCEIEAIPVGLAAIIYSLIKNESIQVVALYQGKDSELWSNARYE